MSDNNPFTILDNDSTPINHGESAEEERVDGALKDRIDSLIASSKVFLFMKGNPEVPRCGFSANLVGMLNRLKVPYKTFDILSDGEMREAIKEYSSWPTYPQLYVNKKFIGGNDIAVQLFESGELQSICLSEA